jgi:hydrogenase expression/formation protein HypD
MMKFIDDFRNAKLAKPLVTKLHEVVKKPMTVMEVCGTHTMSIFRNGIRDLLPDGLRLVSGPGCPVCVTPQGYLDEALRLAQRNDVIITTFGDMLRVPGTKSSLLKEQANGHDIRIVYAPLDAVDIAATHPDKHVVFLGVGFETTAPIVALTILEAARRGVANYSVFSAHKTVPPAMAALAADPELKVEGFLCPGHVSAVIGTEPYQFLADKYGVPAVIAGFESLDILQGMLTLAELVQARQPKVVNNYTRVVMPKGNVKALETMYQVFHPGPSAWRGIGVIPDSGLQICAEYAAFDTRKIFDIQAIDTEIPSGCSCGEILKGKKIPPDCKLYKTVCTPENPVGSCMVSTEGTCAAYFKYGLD